MHDPLILCPTQIFLQSTLRARGLSGESGRDSATKFTFLKSVRSLKTVLVPTLRLELDREDDSLLFVRLPHECVLDALPRHSKRAQAKKNARGIWTILEGSQARSTLLFRIRDAWRKDGGQATQRQTRITWKKRKRPDSVRPTTSQNTVWGVSVNTHFADKHGSVGTWDQAKKSTNKRADKAHQEHACRFFHFFFFFICSFFHFLLVSEGASHSHRRVRSGLVVGHPQPGVRSGFLSRCGGYRAFHSLPIVMGTRVLWMSCRDPRV